MEKNLAKDILKQIKEYKSKEDNNYNVNILKPRDYIGGFHQWVDGKDILGIVNVSNGENTYYFVFIDWQINSTNYYIVVFSNNKANTLIELNKTEELYDSINLEWRYKPSKRDGMNEKRRECFKKYYGEIIVRIEVPKDEYQVEGFLDDIFDLAKKRIKCDNLEFNEDTNLGFPEGRVYERLHKSRERNSKLIRTIKNEILSKTGKLDCEVFGFKFYDVYGDVGKDFMEAHHIIPVSTLKEESETKKEDIILVCSNCHSMIHKKRPWLSIEDIKKLIK